MDKIQPALDRLLRAAAASSDAEPATAPFGFETRVVAQWRAQRSVYSGGLGAFARTFRRVIVGAALVTVCASAGAYWQLAENDELAEPSLNTYAIADSAIEAGSFQ